MSKNQWLLLATAAFTFFGMGQIWLVQLSSYHVWSFVGQREFHAYHVAWWHSIWVVIFFIPAGLVFVSSLLMFWFPPPRVPHWAVWLGFGIQVLMYGLTAVWWGPMVARLSTPETGLSLPLYHTLMVTDWLRVAIITAYALLAFSMLTRSAFSARLTQRSKNQCGHGCARPAASNG